MADVRFGAHVEKGPDGMILIVINKIEGSKMTVLQIGAEYDPIAAGKWGSETIKAIRDSGNDQAHVPDWFERRNLTRPMGTK